MGYRVQKDAVLDGETYDPRTGIVNRRDGGIRRWIRGFKRQLVWNTFDVLYGIAALATAGLGIYASVLGMHDAFSSATITSFTCKNPAGG